MEEPKPGQVYRHYKGGIYVVVGVAINTETEERLVIYHDGDGNIWGRPVGIFCAAVPSPSGYLMSRFTRVTGS